MLGEKDEGRCLVDLPFSRLRIFGDDANFPRWWIGDVYACCKEINFFFEVRWGICS